MTEVTYEQLQGILKGNKHYEIVPFPGVKDFDIAIRVLSQSESDLAIQKAELKFLKNPEFKNEKFRDTVTFAKEVERHLIYMSVYKVPNDPEQELERFFPSPDSVGELTVDTADHLHSKYLQVQEKYNPNTKVRDEKELEELINNIKKNSAIGLYLSTVELVALLDYLVQNPSILQKDNGSTSSVSKSEKTKLKKNKPSVDHVQVLE